MTFWNEVLQFRNSSIVTLKNNFSLRKIYMSKSFAIEHNMYLYKTLTQAIAYNVVKEYDKSYRSIGCEGVCLCVMDDDPILISETDTLETFELEGVVYIKFDVRKWFKENPERHDYEYFDHMPDSVWVAAKPV